MTAKFVLIFELPLPPFWQTVMVLVFKFQKFAGTCSVFVRHAGSLANMMEISQGHITGNFRYCGPNSGCLKAF